MDENLQIEVRSDLQRRLAVEEYQSNDLFFHSHAYSCLNASAMSDHNPRLQTRLPSNPLRYPFPSHNNTPTPN